MWLDPLGYSKGNEFCYDSKEGCFLFNFRVLVGREKFSKQDNWLGNDNLDIDSSMRSSASFGRHDVALLCQDKVSINALS
jgi:hypothetical protein